MKRHSILYLLFTLLTLFPLLILGQSPTPSITPENSVNPFLHYQFWIGFGFVTVLLIVLVVIFFIKPNLTNDQRKILAFLISACGGFAGGLITGQILLNVNGKLEGVSYGISASAGFALLIILLWFFYPRESKKPPDSINFAVPKGCTFQQAVEILVQNDKAVADYRNFTDIELQASLQERELHEKTISDAISRLRFITIKTNIIAEYRVEYNNSVYTLSKV